MLIPISIDIILRNQLLMSESESALIPHPERDSRPVPM